MSDDRWLEVDADVASAVEHFSRSAELYAAGGMDREGLDGYVARMAFMHGMQSGHTSMESALVRLLRMTGEELPDGPDWHADLIRRVSRATAGRPAILTEALRQAAGVTRGFRHRAMRSYDDFNVKLAQPAVDAGLLIAGHLGCVIGYFRRAIDPD